MDWGRIMIRETLKRSITGRKVRTVRDLSRSGSGGGSKGGSMVAGVPCKVTGGNAVIGFAVDVYADGIGETSTGSGTLYILEVAASAVLPVGAWVMGWPNVTLITGGSE